ncbi:MAG: zinc ribbon domain-containing protein [Candidatus Marinimicrobia bacterium]|nr:zinc ribbon domain-containing protein [Candidatus Neomarinimicrobiota bacterium]
MPIYDYKCQSCGRVFSALVSSSATPASEVECPECGEHQAEKQLSMKTSVLGGNASSSGGGCSAPTGSGFA